MIRINAQVEIPESEIRFVASRGGGPGGQHVNKVASRVTLLFDVGASPALSEADRARLREKLATRISGEGVFSLSSHGSRSQAANKAELIGRFTRLLRAALKRPRFRHKTRPTAGSRERRLEGKKHRRAKKRARAKIRVDSE